MVLIAEILGKEFSE
jgi:hypothetical protein